MLVKTVADYPGLAKLLSMKQAPTPHACFTCEASGWKPPGFKCIYPHLWRWLPANDPLRADFTKVNRQRDPVSNELIDNDTSAGPFPRRRLKDLAPNFEPNCDAHWDAERRDANARAKLCVLWRLPYYDPLLIAGFDMMHALGGVFKDLYRCMRGQVATALVKGDRCQSSKALDYEANVNG
jgi:hypothetical protein